MPRPSFWFGSRWAMLAAFSFVLSGPLACSKKEAGSSGPGSSAASAPAEADPGPAGQVWAVAPFADASSGFPGLGLLVADHITRVLLSEPSPAPEYAVFGWRQTASAARGADIGADELMTRATELAKELGADRLVLGKVSVAGDEVKLEWKIAGENKTGLVSGSLGEVSELAYRVGTSLRPGVASPTPLSEASAKHWAKALGILARQSKDPRASIVLGPKARSEALEATRALTADAPSFAPGWAARAVASVVEDDWDEAKDALKKAAALDGGGGPEAVVARYYVSLQQVRQSEALEALEAGSTNHPASLQLLGYLGDGYYGMSNYADALGVFERYLERAPKSPYAARRRDNLLARMGKREQAVENAMALAERHPGSLTALAALASRQIDARKLGEARKTLERGLSSAPDHPLLLTRLSYVELEDGDAEKALELAELAVARLGKGRGETLAGYAHIDLARALAVAGRKKEAKESLLTAIRLGIGASALDAVATDPRLSGFIKFPIVLTAED